MKITEKEIEEMATKWCDENAECWNAQHEAFIVGAKMILYRINKESKSWQN